MMTELGKTPAEAKAFMSDFDDNADGTIDTEEFKTLYGMSKLSNADDIKKSFDMFDKDGDGTVSHDEIMKMCKNLTPDAAKAAVRRSNTLIASLLLKRGDTAHAGLHLESFLRHSSDDDDASPRIKHVCVSGTIEAALAALAPDEAPSAPLAALLTAMCQIDPAARPSAAECLHFEVMQFRLLALDGDKKRGAKRGKPADDEAATTKASKTKEHDEKENKNPNPKI